MRAKPDYDHVADLNRLDLLLALLLHVLVFTAISILAYWHQQHRDEPLKRIEVMMISAKELAKLQQQARALPKAKPVARQPKPKTAKVKPVLKPKPAPKSRPVAKTKAKIKPLARTTRKAKPKPVSKPKTKAATKVKDDYDPFAPVESATDRKSAPAKTRKKPKTTQPELADIAGKQLSKKDKDRYIALIQAAVQEQWKVPANPGDVVAPLVEMRLLSNGQVNNGQVKSISILESSGSAALDASLIRAIRAAAPFELPTRQFEFFRVNRMRFHPLK
jgi:TonB family protein